MTVLRLPRGLRLPVDLYWRETRPNGFGTDLVVLGSRAHGYPFVLKGDALLDCPGPVMARMQFASTVPVGGSGVFAGLIVWRKDPADLAGRALSLPDVRF